MKSTMLQRAIELAVRAHAGYEDPPGEPYIVHPMRVLLAVSRQADFAQDEPLRCVAILHDVLERTEAKHRHLKAAELSKDVIEAVELLTHEESKSYADYVIALKPNRLARMVKLADLADNHDLRHIPLRPKKFDKDSARPVRYMLSYQFLLDQLSEKDYRSLMTRVE